MKWSLVKSWAKSHGYESFREETDRADNPNKYDYYWAKSDDPQATGLTNSVSSLALEIYNHITSNQHIEYQKEYQEQLSQQDVKYDTGYGF